MEKYYLFLTLSIIVFFITFNVNEHVGTTLFGSEVDIQIDGIIFLSSMIGYKKPAIKKFKFGYYDYW